MEIKPVVTAFDKNLNEAAERQTRIDAAKELVVKRVAEQKKWLARFQAGLLSPAQFAALPRAVQTSYKKRFGKPLHTVEKRARKNKVARRRKRSAFAFESRRVNR